MQKHHHKFRSKKKKKKSQASQQPNQNKTLKNPTKRKIQKQNPKDPIHLNPQRNHYNKPFKAVEDYFHFSSNINKYTHTHTHIQRERVIQSLNKLTLELIKPAADAIKCGPASDIIDNKSSDGATVVSGGNSPEAFLAGGVPNLSLDLFAVNVHTLSLKLDSNGGLRVHIEFVPGITRQKVRFTHRRVSDYHDLEQILLSRLILRRRHVVSATLFAFTFLWFVAFGFLFLYFRSEKENGNRKRKR